MKKNFVMFSIGVVASFLSAHAQTDVSSYYLQNAGFDTDFNYDDSYSGNVSGDVINDVSGWTNETEATYTIAGTFAYNTKVTFNASGPLPASGYLNSKGGALALTTGWGMVLKYSQPVTLPKGKYRLAAAYYNAGIAVAGTSLLGWIPTTGTETLSTVKRFPVKRWMTDTLSFTLSAQTTGKIQIGFAAVSSVGSANQAKLLVDYVKLLCDEMDKTELNNLIAQAETLYGDGNGIFADELRKKLEVAKTASTAEETPVDEVLNCMQQLKECMLTYQLKNASVEHPLDMTDHLANPSFEDGFTGWTNEGMKLQTNTAFPYKKGSTYVEEWCNIGSHVTDGLLQQTLTDIPSGKYRLTVAAGNIQQKTSGSTVNATSVPQTGVTLFADFFSVPVNTIAHTSVDFVVTGQDVTVGLKIQEATGNWVTCDNFRLYYIGENSGEEYATLLKTYLVSVQNEVLSMKMQKEVRLALETAVEEAQKVLLADSLSETNVAEAKLAVETAVEACRASIALYTKMDENLAYAKEVWNWYKEDSVKAGKMQTAIEVATEKSVDYEQTSAELRTAISSLQAVTSSVDKKVYTANWQMGDISNPDNNWSKSRSKQSKDWILFWEKGYGENPKSFVCGSYTVDINQILEHAEIAFNFYTDSLKFIRRATSKTQTYKMVIRLRYTTDWEATGSGVDDLIGLLTLTPWAAASRSWQTLYHEIGHCFQYQTHCDNGNSNGWMYAIGSGCAFWEQCAQWQAYKIMPSHQFTNEWYSGYLSNCHKHILHESPRYNNYFVQDYWAYRHGVEIVGRLWNESKSPEDAIQAYLRITGITIKQFNDELYDCAARFVTWDLPVLRSYGASYYSSRTQPGMTNAGNNYWRINTSACPENTGHNIIKLNTPIRATTVSVCFEGLPGADGYRSKNITSAGWRYGFVALLKDGTRVYSGMGSASYSNPIDTLRFDCPANCKNLWLVVTGAPSRYWQHLWDDNDSNDEQWPYQVKFDNTNRYGNANVTEVEEPWTIPATLSVQDRTLHIRGVEGVATLQVYSVSGQCIVQQLLDEPDSAVQLATGIYIVRLQGEKGCVSKKVKIQ